MKKRWISGLAAAVLCIALAGCGDSSQPQRGTITPAKTQQTDPAATETTTVTDGSVSLGRIVGGSYENTYAGYGCKLDENWQYYTAEELQDLSELTQELLEDSKLAEQTGSYAQITDMMAENAQSLQSMNVLYTRLSFQERLLYSNMSEEALIDTTLKQKDVLLETYAQAGMDVSSIEKVQVSFLGEEHYAIRTTAKVQGVDYYILQLFDFNLGGQYYVTLTMSSFEEDTTSELLDLFYPVE